MPGIESRLAKLEQQAHAGGHDAEAVAQRVRELDALYDHAIAKTISRAEYDRVVSPPSPEVTAELDKLYDKLLADHARQ